MSESKQNFTGPVQGEEDTKIPAAQNSSDFGGEAKKFVAENAKNVATGNDWAGRGRSSSENSGDWLGGPQNGNETPGNGGNASGSGNGGNG
jgi:hypothetical protein